MNPSEFTETQLTIAVPGISQTTPLPEYFTVETSSKVPVHYFADLIQLSEQNNDIKLLQPVRISICEDAEGVRAENDSFSIFASGFTASEAMEDFEQSLISTWEGLKNMTNDELTQDAIELKERLASLFSA